MPHWHLEQKTANPVPWFALHASQALFVTANEIDTCRLVVVPWQREFSKRCMQSSQLNSHELTFVSTVLGETEELQFSLQPAPSQISISSLFLVSNPFCVFFVARLGFVWGQGSHMAWTRKVELWDPVRLTLENSEILFSILKLCSPLQGFQANLRLQEFFFAFLSCFVVFTLESNTFEWNLKVTGSTKISKSCPGNLLHFPGCSPGKILEFCQWLWEMMQLNGPYCVCLHISLKKKKKKKEK